MIILAIGAICSAFLAGLTRERANFYTGASKAKAGQCLRSLVYKRIASADFMF